MSKFFFDEDDVSNVKDEGLCYCFSNKAKCEIVKEMKKKPNICVSVPAV